MTISEIRASDKLMLTPSDVAPVLGCHPYAINVQVKDDASKLGFPVSLIGTRVKIPREGFLRWFDGLQEATA
jgi:hypothetical protein